MVNQQNVKLTPQDIVNAKTVVCEECSHDKFTNHFLMKQISALLSPTGQEIHVPIPVFACSKCGHVNKNFLPESQES